MSVLFYDYERDGVIPIGAVLLVYKDGHTELRKQGRQLNEPRAEGEQRRPRDTKRSGLTGITQRHKGDVRQSPKGRRIPLRKIKPSEPMLSEK